MLFSLAAGAISDNFDRRKLMLGAQIYLLCVSVLLAFSTYLGFISPWVLLGFTFLIGCGTAFNGPAWQSLVGEMVPRSDLPVGDRPEQHGFQPGAKRGAGAGRSHRRGGGRCHGLRHQCRQLYRIDRRAGALVAGGDTPARCRRNPWAMR